MVITDNLAVVKRLPTVKSGSRITMWTIGGVVAVHLCSDPHRCGPLHYTCAEDESKA